MSRGHGLRSSGTAEALGSHVPLVQLGDLDLLLAEIGDPEARTRLKKLGFSLEGVAHLERARAKLAAAIDRRWMLHYDRAHRRYGRAVVGVRDRVCMGCFVTLPTSAQPRLGEGEGLGVCESCGRILYWG